ncbi:MAG: leucyl aminopeptidase family protein, partial [Pseudomonadota bacterium]
MPLAFAEDDAAAIPLHVVDADALAVAFQTLQETGRAWAQTQGFTAGLGQVLHVPDEKGSIAQVLVGYGTAGKRARGRFHMGAIAKSLPQGTYRIASGLQGRELEEAALAWLLAGYAFDQYRKPAKPIAMLAAPPGI